MMNENVISLLLALAVGLFVWEIGPIWDKVTAKQIADLSPRMQELRLDRSALPRYLRWWGISMLVVFVFFTMRGMIPVGLTAVYMIYISPRLVLSSKIRRRSYLLRDQMVGASVALANATRAGLGISQGLATVAAEIDEPLATEFRRIVSDVEHGGVLRDALVSAKNRMQLDSFTLFASAVLVALERGGKLTEALEKISHSLQENQRLERKIEADTASGRQVVLILAAFPFLFLALFSFLEPEGVSYLFTTIAGQIIFVAIVVLVYLAVRWGNKILTVDI